MFAIGGLTSWEQAPIVGVVILVGVFVLRWTDRHQKEWTVGYKEKIAALEQESRLCEWRTEILLGVCRKAGLPIPAAYWTGPPDR